MNAAAGPRDHEYMRRALELARRGWGWTAPNPMVGAVVVRDGSVVGEGWHSGFGGAHAEVEALRDAGERSAGATLYVTLEPCNHHGKTPPCSDAVAAAGISRVVIGARDPNPEAGGGVDALARSGIEVETGVLDHAAQDLDPAFFHRFRSPRAWVTLKLAMSLDAAIADASGASRWITGPEARGVVHHLRAGHDAVGVGIGTAIADDPLLTVRDAESPRVPPARVVFDRRCRLPSSSALVRSAADSPVIVVATDPASARARELEALGVRVVRAADLAEALVRLRELDIGSLLVEGGAAISASLLADGLVDRFVMFQAPVILGAGARGAFAQATGTGVADARKWRVVERREVGDDLMTVLAPPA